MGGAEDSTLTDCQSREYHIEHSAPRSAEAHGAFLSPAARRGGRKTRSLPRGDPVRASASQAQMLAEGDLFAGLEAFLASWARLSLLFFPADRSPFAGERGKCLVSLFDVGQNSPLQDRRLRDSWMHFDERLDAMIKHTGIWHRHRFLESTELRDDDPTLRVVEIDTLHAHYRDRELKRQTVHLPSLRAVIHDLDQRWQLALERLRHLYPASKGDRE